MFHSVSPADIARRRVARSQKEVGFVDHRCQLLNSQHIASFIGTRCAEIQRSKLKVIHELLRSTLPQLMHSADCVHQWHYVYTIVTQ